MAISHVKSVTIADGTNTNIVRPGDWNSAHNVFYTLTGNTNNASTVSGSNVIFSGGSNVTLVGSSNSIGFSVGNYITTGALSDHSHGNPTLNLTNLSGTTGSASNGLTISLSAGNYITTGAQSDHSHGNPTLNLTNLSGTTASASNGLTISLSAAAPGGGAGQTFNSGWSPRDGVEWVAGQQGNGTCFVQPMVVPGQVNVSNFKMPSVYTNASNSSNSFTVSFWVGVYTKNGASLSSLHSTSWSTNITNSGTAGSYSLFAVMKVINIPWTTTITAGEYWVGIVSRTTTGAGAGMTMSQMLASQPNSNWSGYMGVANNATNQVRLGLGFYGTTTAGVLGSMAFSQIQGTGSLNLRPPIFFFGGSTH